MGHKTCKVAECENHTVARTLCAKHYQRLKARGSTDDYPPRPGPKGCEIPGCVKFIQARGLCAAHYQRRRLGKDMEPPLGRGANTTDPDDWTTWPSFRVRSGYTMRCVTFAGDRVTMFEHRLVMGDMLGRDLLPEENVHHINGVRDDNSPRNLELWSKSQPPGQRVSDKVAWAKEMLNLYEPEALK